MSTIKIIGINSKYNASMDEIYSGSAALIIDGKIEMAVAEERISRVKHDGGYSQALDHILKETNLTVDDIDYFYISFYANPVIPDEEMIQFHLDGLGISEHPEKLVVVPSHHLSHAYLAYFFSPFDEAVIMVADNEGSLLFSKEAKERNIINNYCERNSYYWAKGNCITLIERDFEKHGDVAFGKAYNKFNEYLGLGNYLSAGKTMGLSAYGKDDERFNQLDLWGIDEKGHLYSIIKETYDSFIDINNFFKENGVEFTELKEKDRYTTQDYKNLAYYIQNQLNKWAVKKADILVRKTGIKNVCTSGGVALNGIMNREIEEQLGVDVFAPPFPSDPGQALGNAIYGYIHQSNLSNNSVIPKVTWDHFAYLGKSYSDEEIQTAIEKIRQNDEVTVEVSDNICKEAAQLMSEGKVLGWFQGKSEYGARALGNRSVVTTPSSAEVRDRVNVLKGREAFRPLAPSALSEYMDEYFENKRSLLEPYMLRVSRVKEEKISEIEGVVHVDQTARVQAVQKEANAKYHQLITEFYKLTGVPMIMNTSFNLAGDPIVETPQQAFDTFYKMNLDALVIDNFLIKRK